MKIIIPREGFKPVTLESNQFHLGEYGWDWARHEMRKHRMPKIVGKRWLPPVAGGSGQLSAWAEGTVLNHLTGQDNASWANLSPVFLALCMTTLPTSASTGASITEANYTGYTVRTSLANTAWTAASTTGSGAPQSTPNSGTINGPACSGGSSIIIGLAICTSGTIGAGNMIMWCSCANTTISSTQTPPTIAAGGLTAALT